MTRKRTPRAPATLDASTLRVMPTPRRIDLKTLAQVRSEMSRIYRDARAGSIDTSDASRLVFILSSIGKMIEMSDLEGRLARLEEQEHET